MTIRNLESGVLQDLENQLKGDIETCFAENKSEGDRVLASISAWISRTSQSTDQSIVHVLAVWADIVAAVHTPAQRLDLWQLATHIPVNAVFLQPDYSHAFLDRVRKVGAPKVDVLVEMAGKTLVLPCYRNGVDAKDFERYLDQIHFLAHKYSGDDLKNLFKKFFEEMADFINHPHDFDTLVTFAAQVIDVEKLDPSLLVDFLKKGVSLLNQNLELFCTHVLTLVRACNRSKRVHVRRVFQLLGELEADLTVRIIERVTELVKLDIYPTPTVVAKVVTLDDVTARGKFLNDLAGISERIRQLEEIDVNDPVQLEMYYNYLNIPVPFHDFIKIVKEIPVGTLGKKDPKFTSFRVSARGVAAITNNVSSEVVETTREHIGSHSQIATAKEFLQSLPGLPKKVLSKESKGELMRAVALTLTEHLSKAGKLHAAEVSPFNDTNVLGKTATILALPPSYQKISYLQYAIFHLGQFINQSEKTLKDSKYKDTEQAAFRQNIARAHILVAAAKKAIYTDLDQVLKDFDQDPENYKHLSALCESYVQIDLFTKKSPDQERVVERLAQSVFTAAFHHIQDVGVKEAQSLLDVAAYHLFSASLDGSNTQQTLWQCLEIKALLATPDMSEHVAQGKADVVLESAKDLYAEKVPEQFNQMLATQSAEDGMWEIGRKVNDQFDKFAVAEATEVITKVRGLLKGNGDFLRKSSQNQVLVAAFGDFVVSMGEKLKKIEKEFANPPRDIPRNYHVDSIGHLMGSLRYASAKNRDLEKMLAIPELSDQERRVLTSLQKKFSLWVEILRPLHNSLQTLDNSGLKNLDREETLATIKQKLGKVIATRKKLYAGYPAYEQFVQEREALLAQWKVAVDAAKNRLYEEHLVHTGGQYDAAIFHPLVKAAKKDIDSVFSKRLKELRDAFAREHADLVQVVEMIESIGERLNFLDNHLDPLTAIQKERLHPVQTELAKISYEDLGEDEFEFVASKATGDIFKGWVSNDCSTNEGYRRHIASSSFTNYRVYRKKNGERIWTGNVYVLDVLFCGQPVLILDAIQVSRETSVNPTSFLRGVIAGIGAIAQRNHYRYIISNHITSAAEGYLVSNRTQLRQAYMNMFADNQVLHVEPKNIAGVDSTKHVFQSLTRGGGNFKVLWEHPDIRPAIAAADLFTWIQSYTDASIVAQMKAKEKESRFTFGLIFQTSRAWATLQSFAADRQQLQLYLSLMIEYFADSSVHPTIGDPQGLALISRFRHLVPASVREIIHPLSHHANSYQLFTGLVEIGEASENGKGFVEKAISYRLFFPKDQLLALQALSQQYANLGLEDVLFHAVSKSRVLNPAHLERMASFVAATENTPLNRRLVKLMIGASLEDNIDLSQCLILLRRVAALPSSAVPPSLTVELVLQALSAKTLLHVTSLDGILNLLESRRLGMETTRLFAGIMVRDGLIPVLGNVVEVLQDLSWLDSVVQSNQAIANDMLAASDVLAAIKQSPDQVHYLKMMVDALKVSTMSSVKLQLAKRIFQKQLSLKKVARICRAPDELVETHYFFIYNLSDGMIAEDDDLAKMQEKFLADKFEGSALKDQSKLKHLVISGQDYVFTLSQYQQALAAQFDLATLTTLPRTQQGETERLKKAKSDEEIPQGYSSIDDFISDQVSVYTLDFHK